MFYQLLHYLRMGRGATEREWAGVESSFMTLQKGGAGNVLAMLKLGWVGGGEEQKKVVFLGSLTWDP